MKYVFLVNYGSAWIESEQSIEENGYRGTHNNQTKWFDNEEEAKAYLDAYNDVNFTAEQTEAELRNANGKSGRNIGKFER